MNKTISLSAIAMFAVVMGMSAFAPAAMGAPNGNAKADIRVCHYGAGPDKDPTTFEDNEWEVIFLHSQGSLKGHVDKHTDGVFFDVELDTSGSDDISVCFFRNLEI